jgi:hypothetical protein
MNRGSGRLSRFFILQEPVFRRGVCNCGSPATPKTPQNARFAKSAILEKPRKTPGFHRAMDTVPNSKWGLFLPFQELGEFSSRVFRWTKGRTGKKDARQTLL